VHEAPGGQTLVEVGVAMAVLPGELESGDLHLVEPFPGGVLVAAIDGLGHGSAAAQAARLACSTLRDQPGAELRDLFERSHGRLRRTRGVVMSAASFSTADGSMRWLGVGNVEGTLVRGEPGAGAVTESILLPGGVIGYNLPRLRPSQTQVGAGDTLIFATDGVEHGYIGGLDLRLPPQELADRILAKYSRTSDDALVLVARYLGRAR
jgi:negative regulator of sigma-B (phosphoserine phosphatase)